MPQPRYQRVLLKIGGESFCKPGEKGIEINEVRTIARQIKKAAAQGTQIAIVVGGGNIVRGHELGEVGVNSATADYMGMLSTVVNALALQDVLERHSLERGF